MSRFLRVAAAGCVAAAVLATLSAPQRAQASGPGACSTTAGSGLTGCTPDKLLLSSNASRVVMQKTGTSTATNPSTGTQIVWTFWEDVYSDPNNVYCSGCLTWIVKVSSSSTSTDIIEHVTISNFNNFSADIGYLTDGSGNPASEPPPSGADTTDPALTPGTQIPNTVDRSKTGVLTWDFNLGSGSNNISAGQSTVLLEAETNSTQVTDGTVAVIDGVASNQPAYAPALPEVGLVPAFALIGGGAIGARAYRRRRRRTASRA
ncbi:MAG: hypothetical protein ACYDAC_09320 [Candidatus Dormibacteria bacterium]